MKIKQLLTVLGITIKCLWSIVFILEAIKEETKDPPTTIGQ